MKTISGKIYNTNESIVSSIGAGRKQYIDEFLGYLSRVFKNTEYKVNNNESVDFTTDKIVYLTIKNIPLHIRTVTNLNIMGCTDKAFVLPISAKTVIIEDCSNLEEIFVKDSCDIKELYILNCSKLKNISALSNANINRIKIYNCPITSINSLSGVKDSIYIKNCTDLKSFDLKTKNVPNIKLERCKINDFECPVNTKKLSLLNVTRSKNLNLNIEQAIDILIQDLSKTKEIIITGNPVETMVINGIDLLEKLNIDNDCRQSLSLCNLPEIEQYNIKDIKGMCVTENVKTIPQIKCKRMINRK